MSHSDISCGNENQNTHFMFNKFPSQKNRTVYEIMWGKYGTAGYGHSDDITRRMRFAWWPTEATKTHSEYVILFNFLLQRWLQECASVLRYTCIACLVSLLYPEEVNVLEK